MVDLEPVQGSEPPVFANTYPSQPRTGRGAGGEGDALERTRFLEKTTPERSFAPGVTDS